MELRFLVFGAAVACGSRSGLDDTPRPAAAPSDVPPIATPPAPAPVPRDLVENAYAFGVTADDQLIYGKRIDDEHLSLEAMALPSGPSVVIATIPVDTFVAVSGSVVGWWTEWNDRTVVPFNYWSKPSGRHEDVVAASQWGFMFGSADGTHVLYSANGVANTGQMPVLGDMIYADTSGRDATTVLTNVRLDAFSHQDALIGPHNELLLTAQNKGNPAEGYVVRYVGSAAKFAFDDCPFPAFITSRDPRWAAILCWPLDSQPTPKDGAFVVEMQSGRRIPVPNTESAVLVGDTFYAADLVAGFHRVTLTGSPTDTLLHPELGRLRYVNGASAGQMVIVSDNGYQPQLFDSTTGRMVSLAGDEHVSFTDTGEYLIRDRRTALLPVPDNAGASVARYAIIATSLRTGEEHILATDTGSTCDSTVRISGTSPQWSEAGDNVFTYKAQPGDPVGCIDCGHELWYLNARTQSAEKLTVQRFDPPAPLSGAQPFLTWSNHVIFSATDGDHAVLRMLALP